MSEERIKKNSDILRNKNHKCLFSCLYTLTFTVKGFNDMSTICAPAYANIFMANFQLKYINPYTKGHTGKTRAKNLRGPKTQDSMSTQDRRRTQEPRRTQNPRTQDPRGTKYHRRTEDPLRIQDPLRTQDASRTQDLYYLSY